MSSLRRIAASDILIGFLFSTLVFFGTFLYMSRERMIYSWDEANYTMLTGLTYEAFFPANPDIPGDIFRPVYGLRHIHASFTSEYNQLFALPLVFFERLFGASRSTFVLGLMTLFFIPYSVLWGLVAQHVFVLPKRTAFWATLAMILAMPLTLIPALRGFPDVGAAALLGLAVFLYLRDVELRSWWQCLAISLVLCVLPLFRRHFMYGLSAFLAAALLQHAYRLFLKIRVEPKEAWGYLWHIAIRFLSVGIIIAAMWFVFANPFVRVLVSNNYFRLYESFMIPPKEIVTGYASAYGYILTGCALIGYVLGFRSGIFRSPGGQFIALLAAITILQWIFFVRQQATHYLTHFSIYIVFGLLALLIATVKTARGIPRFGVFAVLTVILAYRAVFCFGGMNAVDSPDHDGVLIAQQPPKVRGDYEEVRRLLTILRKEAGGGPAIFTAACSWMMNSDVLRNGEEDMFGKQNRRLNILQPPAVDSRDALPLDMLLKSDYVLTVTPVQYSVSPGEQKLVALVVDAFEQNLPLARDFELLPGTFRLENNATGKLYRRIRTSGLTTALSELMREESYFTTLPGRQKAWVSLDGDARWELQNDRSPFRLLFRDSGYRTVTLSPEVARRHTLAYVGTTTPIGKVVGRVTMTGHWDTQIASIRAVWVDSVQGKELGAATTAIVKDSTDISLPLPPIPVYSGKSRLLLHIVLPPEADRSRKELTDGQFIWDQLMIR